jgi:hypothetical protein
MPLSVKQLTVNTTVKKDAEQSTKKGEDAAAGLSPADREKIIEECMKRVRELIEYELRP